jgi:WS/DGAT/MGAT family acyltransferase
MAEQRLGPLDAIWLRMESDETPMHVGVLAIFSKPRQQADFLARLSARMRERTDLCAPWNQRIESDGASLLPRRRTAPDVDLHYHLRHLALPAPGGERELGELVSRLHSKALDRTYPLWEVHLIEGLHGGRFAIFVKVHHALVDDINGVSLLLDSLSDSVKRRNHTPFWCKPAIPGERATGADVRWQEIFSRPLQSLQAARAAGSGLLQGTLRRGVGDSFLSLRGTPRSTLNRRINHLRRVATQQLSLARVETLAAATDSTVNEILTYLCGSSLRRFFKEYNALPDQPLVAVIPVSLQERSTTLPGNAIAGLRVELGTHIGDPHKRLAAVKASIAGVRQDRASLPEEAVLSYVMLRAAPLFFSQLSQLGGLVPPVYNLAVSNTPLVASRRYLDGARLEAIYPVSPLLQFSALSIDCVSYAGMLNIGFTGARDTLPHLQRLAVYLGKALEDFEQLLLEESDE